MLGLALVSLWPRAAPATVEEQRARLPPPAVCTDEVEGVWMSHHYSPDYHDWYIFTMRVHRVAAGAPQLTGDIQAHSWDGGAADSAPPACRPGLRHWIVRMTGRGTILPDHRIHFGGVQWAVEQAICGRPPQPGEYNTDQFSGLIDGDRQEFQSVDNDGGRSVNEPVVFRRVQCFEPPPVPHVTVAPPPFQPPQRAARFFNCGGP